MKLTTIIATITMLFSAIAAEKQLPDELKQQLDAKDWQGIIACTNYSSLKIRHAIEYVNQNQSATELKSFANALMSVDCYNMALHAFMQVRDYKGVAQTREAIFAKDFISTDLNKEKRYFIGPFSKKIDIANIDKQTLLAMADKIKTMIENNNINTNIKMPSVIEFVNYANSVYKVFGVDTRVVPAASLVVKNAEKYIGISPIISLWPEDVAIQTIRTYINAMAPAKNNSICKAMINAFADRVKKSKNQALIDAMYSKLDNPLFKAQFAVIVDDKDKVLDALSLGTQNSFDAETIAKALNVINGQPADWKKDEVIAVLKNINAMYTVKLYDDRDTWEPVLSKLRAILEVRQ